MALSTSGRGGIRVRSSGEVLTRIRNATGGSRGGRGRWLTRSSVAASSASAGAPAPAARAAPADTPGFDCVLMSCFWLFGTPPLPFTLVRILVVSALYPPVAFGGYEVECSGVVERLRERGEVLVLTSDLDRDGLAAQTGVRRASRA